MSYNHYAQGDLNLPTSSPDISSTPSNPDSNLNGSSSLQDVKQSTMSSVQSTMNSIQNHPTTQNVKDSVVNGPVGSSIQSEYAKTSSGFQDLANSKVVPDQPAATGQPLTHYHSMFYRLLSWKNPRATAITFLLNVLLIFAARYLNVVRYVFKGLYIVLGVTAAAEIAGKALLGDGLATRMRPRKYFTIPKESLERFLDDFEQFINFFVIEFQRVVFAENIWATVGAFFTFLTSYFLIKWLPLWGLTLLFTSTVYLAPLVYIKNKDVIDAHLEHAGNVVGQQANQVKDLAAQHTGTAVETVRSYAGEYSQKAQSMMGQSRQKINGVDNGSATAPSSVKSSDFSATAPSSFKSSDFSANAPSSVKSSDFPSAPKEVFPAAPMEVFPTAPKEDPVSHAESTRTEAQQEHAY